MKFDIKEFSQEELDAMSNVQMQILRSAQKQKNELVKQTEEDINFYNILYHGNGFYNSSLFEQKKRELNMALNEKVAELVEQLEYSLNLNQPETGSGDGSADTEKAGYVVDYSLPYSDRYSIVREYYLSISDPELRMYNYTNDSIAKQYLGKYYTTLYDVLSAYSK